MNSLPERVAKLALASFDALPQKCKPRVHTGGRREWTPMSAVVIGYGQHHALICVSLAIGTKCLPASALTKCSGLVLHDSHAEVLALRGLNYWLLVEVRTVLQDPTYRSPFVEVCEAQSSDSTEGGQETTPTAPFRLKSDVSIYFFTTEAPCGDASMELLMNSMPPDASEPWEVDSSIERGITLNGRGHFSMLGYVRRKPARADAEASNSKSCTDKLSLKQFTSALSFPTDILIQRTKNAFLRGLIVYTDQYNELGYNRAFSPLGRLKDVSELGHFFTVQLLPVDFPRFPFDKSAHESDSSIQQKPKTTNIAVLRITHALGEGADTQEILVNGVKQGYKQWDQRESKASVVSRKGLWKLAKEISETDIVRDSGYDAAVERREPISLNSVAQLRLISQALSGNTYGQVKSTALRSQRKELKSHITKTLGNWHSNEGDTEWPHPAT